MGRINPKRERDAVVLAERRKQVASLYLRGETQQAIGNTLKVDQSTVSRDLSALQDEWRAAAKAEIDEIKARELAKIDETERQAWEGWTRSLKDAESVRTTIKPGNGRPAKKGTKAAGQEVVKTVEGQAGDPRFLGVVLDCVRKRCEIFGIKKDAAFAMVAAAKVYIGFNPDEEI